MTEMVFFYHIICLFSPKVLENSHNDLKILELDQHNKPLWDLKNFREQALIQILRF
jgi:hypothetical protein